MMTLNVIKFFTLFVFFFLAFEIVETFDHEMAHIVINRYHGVDSEMKLFDCGGETIWDNMAACVVSNSTDWRALTHERRTQLLYLHSLNEVEGYNHSSNTMFFALVVSIMLSTERESEFRH